MARIRKIRGLIHRATRDYEYTGAMRAVIDGHIASLYAVYGKNLPRQIAIPYEAYQKAARS